MLSALLATLPLLQDVASRAQTERARLEARLIEVEAEHGEEHADTVRALSDLGLLLWRQGDYAGAEPHLERAVGASEVVHGPEDPETLQCLSNLATLRAEQGDYAEALRLNDHVLDARERVLGAEHPKTASTHSNRGLALWRLGRLGEARTALERSLAIREAALGAGHAQTLESLINLGAVLIDLADYAEARAVYERALVLSEELHGPEHPMTGTTLNNLGYLLRKLGDLDAARERYERALAIREQTLGPQHPRTSTTLNNLAVVVQRQGDAAAAVPLLERALEIAEIRLGRDHPNTARAVHNLAYANWALGQYDLAQPLLERALEVRETRLGPEHPATLHTLHNLAWLYWDLGDPETARPLMERVVEWRVQALGADHPDAVNAAYELAQIDADLGRAADGLADARGDREHHVLLSLSEAERYRYLADLFWQLELHLSLEEAGSGVDSYERVLAWKGRVGRMLLASRRRLAATITDQQRALVGDLHDSQAELSKLALGGGALGPASSAQRERRNRLERELQQTLGDHPVAERVTFERLRSSLPAGSALIDFLLHRTYRPARVVDGVLEARREWRPPHVTAWITRPDRETPARVDLGPAAALEETARAYFELLSAERGEGIGTGAADRAKVIAALRAALWDPLAPHVEHAELVFVSPDGFLGAVPLETIERADGDYLIEHTRFVYREDAAGLARAGAAGARGFSSLLSVGAVDFRARSEIAGAAAAEAVAYRSELRGGIREYWGRLPATELESQVVHDLHEDAFPDGARTLLQGDGPTEERLKTESARHAVLHLATHGFFQPDGLPSMWEQARDERGQRELRMNAEARRLLGTHAGLLSGLVCAGANAPTPEGRDDGLLTAEEVGWLDLTGVELVVLSACETGLGRPRSGEGLIGLRRALHTAGARTVVSSLWSVRDESTSDLMQAFYVNLWRRGQSVSEALRSAQLEMLKANRIRHEGRGLPSTWGAFVLSGEWR